MKKALPWVAAGIALVAAALFYFWYLRTPPPGTPQPEPVVERPLPPPAPEPTIVPPQPAEALPGLDQSDAAMAEWLYGILGREAVERYLVRDAIIRKVVATVDNLPEKKVDLRIRAVRAYPGSFPVERRGEDLFLGSDAYSRYKPLVDVLRAVDPVKLADLYVRIYPLLQQAYEDLGYPGRQFHARLLEVIDDLMDAPVLDGPVPLVQPHVLYEFADPELEARSAGQKALMRIGPQNAAVVREKLTAFRAEIVRRAQVPAAGG